MENVRVDDGAQNVNRYIVASFISRWALYEASWQKYYYKNDTRAVKFYDLAVNAAEMVMNSGKYDIVTDFRTLFGSTDLTSNKDCILYRKYDATKGITHSIASSCNMFSPTDVGPNLDLIKSFICVDGKDWQTSSVTKANDFTLSNLVKTRDPRFEASFWSDPTPKSKSCYLYVTKFIPRSALNYLKDGTTPTAEFQSNKNITGYPVMDVIKKVYSHPALPPFLGRATVAAPSIPVDVKISGSSISWSTVSGAQYAVYKSNGAGQIAYLVAITSGTTYSLPEKGTYFVTAVNADNVESDISTLVTY